MGFGLRKDALILRGPGDTRMFVSVLNRSVSDRKISGLTGACLTVTGRLLSTSLIALTALGVLSDSAMAGSGGSAGGSGSTPSFDRAGGAGGSSTYTSGVGAQVSKGADSAFATLGGGAGNNGGTGQSLPGTNKTGANGMDGDSTGVANPDTLNGNGAGAGGGGGGIGFILTAPSAPQTNTHTIKGGGGGQGGSGSLNQSNAKGGGGGGGGGGTGLVVDGSATLVNASGGQFKGGDGASGGASSVNDSGGGGGGGGHGLHLAGGTVVGLTNAGTVTGGVGGASGNNGMGTFPTPTKGGDGGAGVFGDSAGMTLTLDNQSDISGGAGGNAGQGVSGALISSSTQPGTAGTGGAGVQITAATSVTITNDGMLYAGSGGSGGQGGKAYSNGEVGGNGSAGGEGGRGVSVTATTIVLTNKANKMIAGGIGGYAGHGGNISNPVNDTIGRGGAGGTGGKGGDAVWLQGQTATVVNEANASIMGMAGQSGGNAGLSNQVGASGGAGGNGGNGVVFTPGNASSLMTLTNRGSITGGDGGTRGNGSAGGTPPAHSSGGAAIIGKNMEITNSGTLSGGTNGDGTRARAVVFQTGSTGKLILQSGSTINGGALAEAGSTVTLELSGDMNGSVAGTDFMNDYQGFSSLTKSGDSTWGLSGAVTNGPDALKTLTLERGTLAVTGSYTQSANGTMVVQVTPTSSAKMTVTGAAALAGTLRVAYAPGVYTVGTTHTLLEAASVSGTFATVQHTSDNANANVPGLTKTVTYGADKVQLALTAAPENPSQPVVVRPQNDTVFTGAQSTAFQGSRASQAATFGRVTSVGAGSAGVGGASGPSAGGGGGAGGPGGPGGAGGPGGSGGAGGQSGQGDQGSGNQSQANLAGGNLAGTGAMRALSSDAFGLGGVLGAGDDAGEAVAMASLVELFEANPQTNGQYGVWGRGLGRTATVDGTGSTPGFDSRTLGGLVGIDGPVSERLTLGIAGGYTLSLTEEAGGSEVKTHSPRAMVYGSYALANPQDADALLANTVLDFSVGYGWHKIDSERKIASTGETAIGKNTAHELNAGAQVRRQIGLPDPGVDGLSNLMLTPRAGLTYTRLLEGDFTEYGTLANNLSVHERASNSIRPLVGLGLGGVVTLGGTALNSTVDVSYTHELASTVSSRFDVGGGSFSQTGTTPSRGELTVGAGIGFDLTESLSATLNYEAILPTGNTTAHTVETGVRYRF